MPRVNIYLDEALHERVAGAQLNVSAVCQRALRVAVARQARHQAAVAASRRPRRKHHQEASS
ncbi:MAG: type II toxin-antitoxin system CcdA family antitoxin [Solirubrobacteraceae bacterium]